MPINPLYGYIGAAIAIAAFAAGWSVNGWLYQSREAKALEQAVRERDEANERANGIAADYELARTALNEYSGDISTKVRVVYRDRKISPNCAIPDSAARLLDDARNAANAAITGEPDKPVSDNQRSAQD